jgi:cytidylate kinase
MIVTIDGPAGSGKSTAARGLAARLGFEVLDTGAMYRAVALAVLRAEVVETNEHELEELLRRITVEMPAGRVELDGDDVSGVIRTPEVAQAASRVATIPAVRRFLVELQRCIADDRNVICEGRDQGTVVFPAAARKFFFLADPVERARRRLNDLRDKGDSRTTLEAVLAEQQQRDRRDASRDASPMVPAPDAIIIDTTHLTPEQVLDRLERDVRDRLEARG